MLRVSEEGEAVVVRIRSIQMVESALFISKTWGFRPGLAESAGPDGGISCLLFSRRPDIHSQ